MSAAPVIWVDVEDLLQYATAHARPSGIQRLAFEICVALVARLGAESRVRFLRHVPGKPRFRRVPWAQLQASFDQMNVAAPSARPTAAIAAPTGLQRVAQAQGEAFRAFATLIRSLASPAEPVGATPDEPENSTEFETAAQPGDVVLAVGSPWFADYAQRIAAAQANHQVRFAAVIYDMVPVLRPEYAHIALRPGFEHWMRSCLPLADRVFAISRSTAQDTQRFAARAGFTLRHKPVTIPIGTGFRPPAPSTQPVRDGLPPPGSYVLMVSTIEPRKNHELLFRVWRRMLAEMPRAQVPRLVFAGRTGWMIGDFMQRLRNSNFLDGWIIQIADATDPELEALYRGCLFTVFPSFYEGWGLPVTESLAFGKPCVSSNTSSLPEAGGALGRYFDPEDTGEATRLIAGLIRNPTELAAWQNEVQTRFRPVSWLATADAILASLQQQGIPTA